MLGLLGDLFCSRHRICAICLFFSSTDDSSLENLSSSLLGGELLAGLEMQITFSSVSSAKLTDHTAFVLFLELSSDFQLCMACHKYSNASSIFCGLYCIALQAASEFMAPCRKASTAARSTASMEIFPHASVASW